MEIELAGGLIGLLDDEDAHLLGGLNWRPLVHKDTTYVHAWRKSEHLYLHRLVARVIDRKMHVDHRDSNGLNNLRSNLRIATCSQNLGAQKRKHPPRTDNPQSRFKGVYWDKERSRWRAASSFGGKTMLLGRFHDEMEAARAYDRKALETWGDFAVLNLPNEAS